MDMKVTGTPEAQRMTAEFSELEGRTRDKTMGDEMNMEKSKEKRYDAISKNGDTLELSEEGKALKKDGGVISEVTLMGYSKAKLKQLYFQKTITKQQYDKAMERKSIS